MSNRPPWEPVWQGNGEAQATIVADGLRAGGMEARIQGARQTDGLPHMFQMDTWAVFVPSEEAGEARQALRETGEGSGVVEGGGFSSSDWKATWRFVALLAAGVVAVALLLALRESL